jgi:hypothetical protein
MRNKEKTVYDIVYTVLTEDGASRDSDKRLIWMVCRKLGLIKDSFMDGPMLDWPSLQEAPSFESITRARRKAQHNDKEKGDNKIQPSELVQEWRRKKEDMKGNYVYHEEIEGIREDTLL